MRPFTLRALTAAIVFVALELVLSEKKTAAFADASALIQVHDRSTASPGRGVVPLETWRTKRDIANVSRITLGGSTLTYNGKNITLEFLSVVPNFGPGSNYIALIHRYDKHLKKYLKHESLFCMGPDASHRVPVRLAAYDEKKFFIILLCDWPEEEADIGTYTVLLEDANQKFLGQLNASYTPKLLTDYRTVACVRNVWNDPKSNVSGLQNLPQWLDFHRLHGLDHFIIYTTSDMSPALRSLYQPYVEAGVVTRVHFQAPAEKCWSIWKSNMQQTLMMNDCLYRAKGHTKWLFPSLDVDEYLNLRVVPDASQQSQNIASFLDEQVEKYMPGQKVKAISFTKFRFARASPGFLEISSMHRAFEPESEWSKYAVQTSSVQEVGIHQVLWGEGTNVSVSVQEGSVNHYRHPNLPETKRKEFAHVLDELLLGQVSQVEDALQQRFGSEWRGVLDNASKAEEPVPSWTCEKHSKEANDAALAQRL